MGDVDAVTTARQPTHVVVAAALDLPAKERHPFAPTLSIRGSLLYRHPVPVLSSSGTSSIATRCQFYTHPGPPLSPPGAPSILSPHPDAEPASTVGIRGWIDPVCTTLKRKAPSSYLGASCLAADSWRGCTTCLSRTLNVAIEGSPLHFTSLEMRVGMSRLLSLLVVGIALPVLLTIGCTNGPAPTPTSAPYTGSIAYVYLHACTNPCADADRNACAYRYASTTRPRQRRPQRLRLPQHTHGDRHVRASPSRLHRSLRRHRLPSPTSTLAPASTPVPASTPGACTNLHASAHSCAHIHSTDCFDTCAVG